MPTTCFDNSVWEDLRLRALPAGLRAAFPVLIARLQDFGDGVLTDRELRVDLLGPARFAILTEALIAWNWLKRTPAGHLARAGILAPPSADALRMRERRRIQAGNDPVRPAAGRGKPRSRRSTAPALRAECVETENGDRTASEHMANAGANMYAVASESESESDSDSDSNLIQTLTDGSDQTAGPAPRTPLFDTLRAEGYPDDLLAETARRVGERNLWKERYIRKVAANLLKERDTGTRRDIAHMGTTPAARLGGSRRVETSTSLRTPAAGHALDRGVSLDELIEKNARLWSEYTADRGAAGGAP